MWQQIHVDDGKDEAKDAEAPEQFRHESETVSIHKFPRSSRWHVSAIAKLRFLISKFHDQIEAPFFLLAWSSGRSSAWGQKPNSRSLATVAATLWRILRWTYWVLRDQAWYVWKRQQLKPELHGLTKILNARIWAVHKLEICDCHRLLHSRLNPIRRLAVDAWPTLFHPWYPSPYLGF